MVKNFDGNTSSEKGRRKSGFFMKLMKFVEKTGNLLPHPFTLFLIFIILTFIFSAILNYFNVSVTYLEGGKKVGEEAKTVTVIVKNLLNYETIRKLLKDLPTIYVTFPPLKIIVIMMMGIGFLEDTGFMSSLMRKTVLGAPKYLVTAALVFVGVNANLLSSAGTIFAFTVGGALYKAIGRDPRIGIITGFAACSGGFAANLFVSGTDALLAGITESAAMTIGKTQHLNPMLNWYFMATATFVLTIVITLVSEKVTAKYIGEEEKEIDTKELEKFKVTPSELRGLKYSCIGFLFFLIVMGFGSLPANSIFRNNNGRFLPSSPLLSSIVPIIFFLFASLGISYGIGAGKIKSEKDIPKLLQKGLKHSIPFLVVALTSSVFLNLLQESKIFVILAVKGSNLIQDLNISPIFLLLLVILITSLVNPFMTSGSEKWLILAPIVVPMFAMANISPALTLLAFRIGDSATNIISPIHSQVPVILGLFEQEGSQEGKNEKLGFGTIFSLTLPFSIAILLSLTLLMIVWYLSGLPIGPGAPLHLN